MVIKSNHKYIIRWYGDRIKIKVVGPHWDGFNVQFPDGSVKLVFVENFIREAK